MRKTRSLAILLLVMALLFSNVIGVGTVALAADQIGQAYVFVEDSADRTDSSWPAAKGTILEPTLTDVYEGDTAADVVKRALDAASISSTGLDTSPAYLSEADGLKAFDAGGMSGWMYTANGYPPELSPGIGAGLSDYIVQNNDFIHVAYTCAFGSDIGIGFGPSSDPVLTGIVMESAGETVSLNESFDADNTSYTATLSGAAPFKIRLLQNPSGITHITYEGTEYKFWQDIPVQDGGVASIAVGSKTYQITVSINSPSTSNAVDITDYLGNKNQYDVFYYLDGEEFAIDGQDVTFVSDSKISYGANENVDFKSKKISVDVSSSSPNGTFSGDDTVTIQFNELSVPIGQVSGQWNIGWGGTTRAEYGTDIPGLAKVQSEDSTGSKLNTITFVLPSSASGAYTLSGGYIYEKANEWSPGIGGIGTEGNFGRLPDIKIDLDSAQPSVDKSALQTKLTQAKAIASNGYTADSFAALQTEISSAQAVLDNSGASQSEVDAAVSALQTAIDNLIEETTVSKTALNNKLVEAGAITSDGYTAESFAALQTAISDAQAVYDDADAAQSEVDNAVSALQGAIDGLVSDGTGYGFALDKGFKNDLWLNTNFETLCVGDTFTLASRQVPELIDGPITNNVAHPDYYYNVIEGSSVSVENSHSDNVTITAVQAGTSIVEVVYDATSAFGKNVGAISEVNKAYAVFVVGEQGTGMSIDTSIDETSYDTIYYADGETVDYAFTVDAAGADSVSVTCNGNSVAASGNTYTAALENRSNIIGITASIATGTTSKYFIIDARKIDIVIENLTSSGSPLGVGDKASVKFVGITMPVYKLATFYNPTWASSMFGQTTQGTRVVYNNSKLGTVQTKNVTQYGLADSNAIEFTVSGEGTYKFTGGYIAAQWWGSPIGEDKTVIGKGSQNLGAATVNGDFSTLPDFEIVIGGSSTTADKTVLEAKLNEAKAILSPGYTSDSFAALQTAIINAQIVFDNLSAVQSEVDDAVTELQAAIDGLQHNAPADKGELEAKLDDAKAIASDGYTAGSFEALQAAISSAQAVFNKSDASQEEVDSATQALKAAIDALVLAGVDMDAQWPTFRPNENNNVVVGIETPRVSDEASLLWSKCLTSGSWTSAVSTPLLVDGNIYAAAGSKLFKYDKNGTLLASATLAASTTYYSNFLAYGNGMIFVHAGKGQIQAFNAVTLEPLWKAKTDTDYSTISPIVYKDGFIYTGRGNNASTKGAYFCIDITDEDKSKGDEVKTPVWQHQTASGYYWSGGLIKGDAIIFAGDDETVTSLNIKDGGAIDTYKVNGKVRSGIVYDNKTGRIVVVTKESGIYSIALMADGTFGTAVEKTLPYQGTSTPVVYGGRVYVGSGFLSDGEISVLDANTLEEIYSEVVGGVQGSLLLTTAYASENNKSTVYVYFTVNNLPGSLYCLKDYEGNTDADITAVYTPEGSAKEFCLASPICDRDGTIYYSNDSGNLFVLSAIKQDWVAARDMIDTLPSAMALSLEDESAVLAARAAFDALSAVEKAKAGSSEEIAALENKLSELKDTTKPVITTSLTSGSAVDSKTLSFTANASDNMSEAVVVEVVVNGTKVDADSGKYNASLSYGSNVIVITAQDEAGNVAIQSYTVVYDSKAPVITTSLTDGAVFTSHNLSFEATAKDAIDGKVDVKVTFNGALVTQKDGKFNVWLNSGTNVIKISAEDELGNLASVTLSAKYKQPNSTVASENGEEETEDIKAAEQTGTEEDSANAEETEAEAATQEKAADEPEAKPEAQENADDNEELPEGEDVGHEGIPLADVEGNGVMLIIWIIAGAAALACIAAAIYLMKRRSSAA